MTPALQQPPAPDGFHGKHVVVTGAARGIGLAIAERFGLLGAHVSLLDVDAAALEAATARMVQRACAAIAMQVDVADSPALLAAAAALAQRRGPCDVLVSNAGVLLRGSLDDEDAIAKWHRTIGVNLDGCFHAVHAFTPQLRQTRGCIVNVASIHSLVAVKNSAAYTASKGGVKQLTQALALELGPAGVRVNAVAPGITETEMTQDLRDDAQALASFMQRIPLRRAAQVSDIADAVQFLASDKAACITGVILPVDGGYCAN